MDYLKNLKGKRWTFIMMAWLLLAAHVHYFFAGLFMTKKELSNKSDYFWASDLHDSNATVIRNGTKVVMMLVDALREDFVKFE